MPHRATLPIHRGLGEEAPELGLAGVSAAIRGLAATPFGVGGHGGHPGTVHRDVEVLHRLGAGEGHHDPGEDRLRLAFRGRQDPRAVGFSAAFQPFVGELETRQLGRSRRPRAKGSWLPTRATIRRKPGRIELPAMPSSRSLGVRP